MFGGGGKKKTEKSNRNLGQYGLFDLPTNLDMNSMDANDDESGGDSDLEAELAAITGGEQPRRPARKKPAPNVNLDAMVAESLKDIPSDAELSGDDDDPDLLNELSELSGGGEEVPEEQPTTSRASDSTKLLEDRLKMYEEAEKNAKTAGESSRARRFHRGVGTLKDLLKQAKAGKAINPDDIPPEVSIAPRKPPPTQEENALVPSRPAPEIPTESQKSPELPQVQEAPEVEEPPQIPEPQPEVPDSPTPPVPSQPPPPKDLSLIKMLNIRKEKFKIAALKAKKSGDHDTALKYIKITKQFEKVIAAAEDGQAIDLSRMPDPPVEDGEKIEKNETQGNSNPEEPPTEGEEDGTLVRALTVAEALVQRLEVYRKQVEQAEEQGNASKARRMGRIVKQYEDAIKMYNAQKRIPIDELPTPPGFGPIPLEDRGKPSVSVSFEPPRQIISKNKTPEPIGITGSAIPNSRAEKQLALLLLKQKQFKQAALEAKRRGDKEKAKEYLKAAKGFDPLIQVANSAMPVDITTLPLSPESKSQLYDQYEIVMADKPENAGDKDVISRLETQLCKQLEMCITTKDHHKALGDVAGANRFERLALNVRKDLDVVRLALRTLDAPVPKFHYEDRSFSIAKSFTELNDNDLELTIIRGISYTCQNPKEIDTYVKFDFPYPQDAPYSNRSSVVKDTNSPEYNETFVIPIQRTARACQRVFKRHSLKLEIYAKSGFLTAVFKGDTLIGTVNVKLQPLETKCELHDSFDLLEGRKKVGGKLEVRLRLRHPIESEQIEQIHEKWLVIDH